MLDIPPAKWMAHLHDETDISSVSIAGTHNSAACFKLAAPSVQCQGKSVSEQLHHGVRYLDIKLSKDYMSRGENVNDLMVVHGKFPVKLSRSYKFKKVLDELYAFLSHNPTETVLVSIKFENTMLNWNAQTDEFAKILFQKYIAHNRDRWYLSDKIPTLKFARGKAILLRRFPVIADGTYKKFGIPALWDTDLPVYDTDSICIQDYSVIKSTSDLDKKVGLFKNVIDMAKEYHDNNNTTKSNLSSRRTSDTKSSYNAVSISPNNSYPIDTSPFSSCASFVSSSNSSSHSTSNSSKKSQNGQNTVKDPKLFINFCSGAHYLHKTFWPSNVDKALRKFNIDNHFSKNCGIIVFDFADRNNWDLVNKLIKTNFI